MQWLPQGREFARGLPPNRLGNYARPEFAALYKPERLEWIPDERYFGRAVSRPPVDYSVLVQLVAQVYDPQTLGWLPSDRYYGRAIAASPKLFQGFALVGPTTYDPKRLEWIPSGRAPQPPLEIRRLGDFQQPGFDSLYKAEALQWQPRGKSEPLPPETRRLGDFQQPQFAALYKSEGLQWFPADRYYGKSLARAFNDWSVLVQLVAAAAYDPQNLEWQPRDRYFGVSLPRALVDWSVLQGDPIVVPAPVVVSVPEMPFSGGARSRKKIRGPYSDPRIYEAYIKRCIAEREKPRINLEAALVKEALVEEVEERDQTGYAEYDALIRENQLLERLLALETAKRNLSAIAARQRQIATQIEALEDDETRSIITLLNEM